MSQYLWGSIFLINVLFYSILTSTSSVSIGTSRKLCLGCRVPFALKEPLGCFDMPKSSEKRMAKTMRNLSRSWWWWQPLCRNHTIGDWNIQHIFAFDFNLSTIWLDLGLSKHRRRHSKSSDTLNKVFTIILPTLVSWNNSSNQDIKFKFNSDSNPMSGLGSWSEWHCTRGGKG